MSIVLNEETARIDPPSAAASNIRVSLLGLGTVGSAIAELAGRPEAASAGVSITTALVRDVNRRRAIDTSRLSLTADPACVLAAKPDVVVEVLGGIEPARTLVLQALQKRVPVVTANKSLLAAYGDELFAAAAASATPLLYEASVLAGVPFLTTFARRPFARQVTAIAGIVNGTSNLILTRMAAERASFDDALSGAQRGGYAEPDPSMDVDGGDALEKLCVLLRHFGGLSVDPAAVEKRGIRSVGPDDLEQAIALGGHVRPLVAAEWTGTQVAAYAGPAFVDDSNPLARVSGVQNAVALTTRWSGQLFFSGPGAGPTVTAATVLDDIQEIRRAPSPAPAVPPASPAACETPATGWYIRLTSRDAPAEQAPAILGSLGVRVRRQSEVDSRDGRRRQWMVAHACSRDHLGAVLDLVASRCGCETWAIRAAD
jgi:homoserine dehydrogenase